VTSVVRVLDQDPEHRTRPEDVVEWVKDQVDEAEARRVRSLFPARSLDLELCIAIPPQWSPPGDRDWVDAALRRRVVNEAATMRERGTAAHGLWRRALRMDDRDYRDQTEGFLRSLVGQLREEAGRDAGLTGLSWVAETVESNLNRGTAVSGQWPAAGQQYVDRVRAALADLSDDPNYLPPSIREGTKTLVEHALLQNAGVMRRHALDALAVGGWGEAVRPVFSRILNDPDADSWLKCRALFAVSFVQDRSRKMINQIERSCKQAEHALTRAMSEQVAVPRAAVSEMHAALFAAGDCFGVAGGESGAKRLRNSLDTMLDRLLKLSDVPNADLHPVGRAAAYFLAMTLQSGDAEAREKLTRYRDDHCDRAVRELCSWALRRFRGSNVLPIHEIVG
jgi:hypothetical protein